MLPLCTISNRVWSGVRVTDKISCSLGFSRGCLGLPDPPVDVQVEPGPQNNTILVTWHPVTAGTSNGAVVTGYAVFADGRKILEIDSPSGMTKQFSSIK